MKKVIFSFVLVAAIVASVALTSYTNTQAQRSENATVERWEYKVVQLSPNDAEYNSLGAEGWELVSATTSSTSYGYSFFKRRLP